MGNHAAGLAMGRMAEAVLKRRRPGESALDLLDEICGPYRGCDAEFEAAEKETYDSYTDPTAALGRLMIEAFAPNGAADLDRYAAMFAAEDDEGEDDPTEAWWDEVYGPFRKRYKFW
jgi:hypothetical protein